MRRPVWVPRRGVSRRLPPPFAPRQSGQVRGKPRQVPGAGAYHDKGETPIRGETGLRARRSAVARRDTPGWWGTRGFVGYPANCGVQSNIHTRALYTAGFAHHRGFGERGVSAKGDLPRRLSVTPSTVACLYFMLTKDGDIFCSLYSENFRELEFANSRLSGGGGVRGGGKKINYLSNIF